MADAAGGSAFSPALLLAVAGLALVLALAGLALAWTLLRRGSAARAEHAAVLAGLAAASEGALRRTEGALRDELQRLAQSGRADAGALQQLLTAQSGDAARTLAAQLEAMRATLRDELRALAAAQEARLLALQQGNEAKLDQMRATVDEKLQATLEQRLSQSFRQVAERLEQVHQGLGEMQTLARDVGALGRVLSNVKTRGIFGEVQLAALLEQVFTPAQFAVNVATVPGSAERVEFALKLPGQRADGAPLLLPIDAKFPREDYERLQEAQERADAPAVEAASRALEVRLRAEARSIRAKYLAPPHTTDFALLFLPTEGLYAEALRRPGLAEALQREHQVVLAGPGTLLALLTALQMGFRTLAIEQRSAEVWDLLGAVKTEFGRFGDVLDRTRKKLHEAAQTIDQAQMRTRAMARQLRAVEALPDARAQALLGPDGAADGTTPGEA